MSDFMDMLEQISRRIRDEAIDYQYKHGGTLEDALKMIKINVNGRTIPAPITPNSVSDGFI